MSTKRTKNDTVRKIAGIGILTALSAVLGAIQIPVIPNISITLVLPVVVIGAALYGPYVGAWLWIIPTIEAFKGAVVFLEASPVGTVVTMLLKGILSGLAAGYVYKALSRKHPIGAVTCAAVAAPVVNTGVFLIGCYLFVWDTLLGMAEQADVGIGALLMGLAIINFAIELVVNIVLCPTIFRIIQIVKKKYM